MYLLLHADSKNFFFEKQKESTILARELLNGCFFYDTEVHTVLVRVSITRIYSTILYDEGQLATENDIQYGLRRKKMNGKLGR